MSISSFALGALSMILLFALFIIVVGVVKVIKVERQVDSLALSLSDMDRNTTTLVEDAIAQAKSYTDSRIDKAKPV